MSFLETVVRPAKDEVSVLSFTGESTLEQGMTNNLTRLRRSIERVQFVPPSGYIGGGVVAGTPPISGDNQAIGLDRDLGCDLGHIGRDSRPGTRKDASGDHFADGRR